MKKGLSTGRRLQGQPPIEKLEVRVSVNIIIRHGIEPDIPLISEITRAAFENLLISNHTERWKSSGRKPQNQGYRTGWLKPSFL